MDFKNKQKNLDSAILFMQQEHATTLKALHDEISNLQKRCSELTFQVAMSNTSLSQEDELREKCELLEKEVIREHEKAESLDKEVVVKNKRISFLEQKVKSQERKIHDLKDSYRQNMLDVNVQLNSKSDAIATLTSKLHRLHEQQSQKKKLSSDVQRNEESRTSSASSSTDGSPRYQKPAPPGEGLPRRFHRRGNPDPQQTTTLVPIPPLKPAARHIRTCRKVTEKPRTPENIPDPTPFLTRDTQGIYLNKREQFVLPPIIDMDARAHHKTDNLTILKHGLQNVETIGNSSPEVEVETLAMKPASSSKHYTTENYNKME